jgi:DNA-directed RNA polymerase subunit beta
MNRLPSEREDAGLQSVFKSVFPISDFRENSSLEFIEYSIGNWECKCGKLQGLHHLRKPCSNCGAHADRRSVRRPRVLCPRCGKANQARGDVCDICGNTVGLKLKYDVDECQERGMTYAVPLKVTIRLVVWNKDPETGVKTIRDIKEQEVYFGDIPLMTDNGTFIINGTERVIVSQLHRSPGAFFHSEDKTLYVAQIIPYRGSWVEFEYDTKNLLYVRIDRKRKFLGLGVPARARPARRRRDHPDLLHRRQALPQERLALLGGQRQPRRPARRQGHRRPRARLHRAAGQEDHQERDRGAEEGANVEAVEISDAELEGAFAAADVVDPSTGEVILEANEELDAARHLDGAGEERRRSRSSSPSATRSARSCRQTLKKDPIHTHEEALIEIYRRLRPGDPPTLDSSRSLFENMFFNPQKYDFSRVGR